MMFTTKRLKTFFWLTCLIWLACGTIYFQAQAVPKSSYEPLPNSQSIFNPILAELKAKSHVPILLPTYLPRLETAGEFYANLTSVQPDSYEIVIGSEKDCSGGNYCRYGMISAQKITSSTPSVEEEYAFMNDPAYRPTVRSPQKMGTVSLANAIKAYFVPYVCGANCDDSKVIWDWNGYRYRVGIKAAFQKAVVEMANSVIQVR